uniref:Ankyrin repeat domain-containing protein n=2 Tax=Lotharella globosa TaxID=91324 RepID=A0A7S4DDU6_9EUKA
MGDIDMPSLGRALLRRAEEGDVEGARKLIAMGADVNYQGPWGYTALHHVAWKMRSSGVEITKYLVNEAKASVEIRSKEDGSTPAINAAFWGNVDVLRVLLKDGKANVKARNSLHNRTSLQWAKNQGQHLCVAFLNLHEREPEFKRALQRDLDSLRMLHPSIIEAII